MRSAPINTPRASATNAVPARTEVLRRRPRVPTKKPIAAMAGSMMSASTAAMRGAIASDVPAYRWTITSHPRLECEGLAARHAKAQVLRDLGVCAQHTCVTSQPPSVGCVAVCAVHDVVLMNTHRRPLLFVALAFTAGCAADAARGDAETPADVPRAPWYDPQPEPQPPSRRGSSIPSRCGTTCGATSTTCA